MAITDSLISFWSLEEESGTRVDAHGSNDLSDGNTVLFTTGVVGNCADFELSGSEYLLDGARWDTAGYPVGDVALSVTMWVRIEAKSGSNATPFSAYNTSDNDRVCQMQWDQSEDRFTWYVSPDGSSANSKWAAADTLGAPSINTWYFIACYHDPDTDLIGIQVNQGGWDTTAYTTGIHDPTDAQTVLTLGAKSHTRSGYWDGEIDEVGIWGKILSGGELTSLYGGGSGLEYPFVTIQDPARMRHYRRKRVAGKVTVYD